LSDYGIKEDIDGCAIISSMEVAKVGETKSGIPVLLDRNARNSDHIIGSEHEMEFDDYGNLIEN
jgi:hypothetical protein